MNLSINRTLADTLPGDIVSPLTRPALSKHLSLLTFPQTEGKGPVVNSLDPPGCLPD